MRLRLVGVPAKEDPTTAVDPLAALSRAAALGDARAIDTLLLSVTPAMLRAVRGVLGGDHREIEDVLQEAAIGLVRAMKTFRGEGTVLHFACRIAVLSALAARRRLREHGKEPLEVPEGMPLASSESSPLELALAVRRRSILRDLCDALPSAASTTSPIRVSWPPTRTARRWCSLDRRQELLWERSCPGSGRRRRLRFNRCSLACSAGSRSITAPVASPSCPATILMTAGAMFFDRPQLAAQFSNPTDFAAAGHQQMDLVHLAIQYDKTRVLSLSWGDVRGTTLYNWVAGVDKDYRTLASNSGVAGLDRDHFIAVQTWLAQQFAYLVSSLASTLEGNGSLLDHTLLVWVSETGEASVRTGKNIPVVIAGNMNGRFRNGAYVQTTGSQANLLSTIASVAGIGAFGDAAIGNTPIAALLN